ncbi:unnamed protein product [Prunus armeniaca]|uniref:Uncharacterized protein n=1 Tax=Prunus armeniaca TaxID=36596 RepID=A0A6J5UL09_PRUAR|nr:unnamed protein product [Prunus armeniaca]
MVDSTLVDNHMEDSVILEAVGFQNSMQAATLPISLSLLGVGSATKHQNPIPVRTSPDLELKRTRVPKPSLQTSNFADRRARKWRRVLGQRG